MCSIGALLFGCSIVKWWKKIGEAAEVINAAGDMLRDTKRLMLVNSGFFLLIIIIIVFWTWGFLGLLSMGEITPNPNIPQGRIIKYSDEQIYDPTFPVFVMIMIFGFFWIVTLTNNVFNYIAMVSTSIYYFTSSEEMEGRARLGVAFKFAFLNNFGSIAYGSIIVAIVGLLRAFSKMAESVE